MKIEFDNVCLEIPDSWKDIKLSDYERWYLLKPETKVEYIQFVADVCKIDAKILLNAPAQIFEMVTACIQFIFDVDFEQSNKIEIDKVTYLISTDKKLTLGEWVDVESTLESDSTTKLSELLAIVCRPVGEVYNPDISEERVAVFKNLTCDKTMPLIAFFLHKKQKSEAISSHCLTVITQANQYLTDIENLALNGAGIRLFPIWQRIRYIYLMRSLKKQLSKFSDSYSIG